MESSTPLEPRGDSCKQAKAIAKLARAGARKRTPPFRATWVRRRSRLDTCGGMKAGLANGVAR
jgi:hypothetical protein